jgi:hypothetical protein
LLANKEIGPAIVCFILSNSVSEVLDLWKKRSIYRMKHLLHEQTRESILLDLFERLILFRSVLRGQNEKNLLEQTSEFNMVITEISHYLTSSEERAFLAMRYLILSQGNNVQIAMQKDRLFKSNPNAFNGKMKQPVFPYQVETIRVSQSNNQTGGRPVRKAN